MRLISDEDIAIIGYAFELPRGINTKDKLWRLLEEGKDVIEEIPKDRWDWKKIYDEDADAEGKAYAHHGAFLEGIDKFDPSVFRITPIEGHNIDPQQRLVLKTAWRAMENSFLPVEKLKHSNTGVFIGATMDDYLQLQTRLGYGENINRYTHFGSVLNNISGRVSFVYGFHGPSVTIDTACSSSLVALDSAIKCVKDGECDIALAGGVNVILTEELYIKFSRTQMLSRTGKCKTFDNSADGYVRGEGCGILVLKKVGRAKAEGKRILAVIRGSSVNHNGNSSGLTVPSGKAQEELITGCMKKAEVSIEDLDYIEAHGTGTQLGDKIEVSALQKVFSGRKEPLLIGSVKTNLGHLESAAGVTGIIKVLLSMEKNIIPRSINLVKKNEHINWDNKTVKVAEENIKWNTANKLAGISSFGASGTNAHVILQKYEPEQLTKQSEWNHEMGLALSAKNGDSLIRLAAHMMCYSEDKTESDIKTICRVNNISRSQYPCRIAVYAATKRELLDGLRKKISNRQAGDKSKSLLMDTIYRFSDRINIQRYLLLYDNCSHYKAFTERLCDEMECSKQFPDIVKESGELAGFILEAAFFLYVSAIGLKKFKIAGDNFTKLELLFAQGKLTKQELEKIQAALEKGESGKVFAYGMEYEQPDCFYNGEGLEKASDSTVIDIKNIESLYGLLMQTAVKHFEAGTKINWDILYNSMDVNCEWLPNYEFSEQSYWVANQQHLTDNISGPGVLSGFINSISCSDGAEQNWIFEIKSDSTLVNGHVINKTKVLVGTCQVQLVQAFLEYIMHGKNDLVIKDWLFTQKIEIQDTAKVQIQLSKEENGARQGMISCWNAARNNWEKKTGFVVVHNGNQAENKISEDMLEDVTLIEPEQFYDRLAAAGLHLGEDYRILRNILYTEKRIYADIKETGLVPAVLDSASQLLYLFSSSSDENELFVPYYFEAFAAYGSLSAVNRVEAELVEQNNERIIGNLYYYNEDRIIAKYEKYHLKRIQGYADTLAEDIIGKCMCLPNAQEIYTHEVKVIGTSLNDHAVYHRLTIPGAYYISQIMYLAGKKGGTNLYTLNDINFYNPVVPDENTQINEVIVVEEKEQHSEIMVSSSVNNNKDYLLNAKISLTYSGNYINAVKIPQLDEECEQLCLEDILAIQRKCGLHLGTTFNWLQEAWIKDNTVQARIYNSNFAELSHKYGVPPGVIDTSVQVLGLLKNNQTKEEGAYIPLNKGQIISYGELQESMWCVSTIIRESGNIIVGDVVYCNKDKTEKILEFKEMSLIKADKQKIGNVTRNEKLLFTESWSPVQVAAREADLGNRTVLELRYGVVSGKTLLNVYEYGADGYMLNEKLVLDWMDENSFMQALKAYKTGNQPMIIVLSDSGAFKLNDEAEAEAVRSMVQNVTEYYFTVLRLLQNMNIPECRIYSITNSACHIAGRDKQENITGSVIWGLVRSVQREITDLSMTVADIDRNWLEVFNDIESCANAGNVQIGLRNNQFYSAGVALVHNHLNGKTDIGIIPEKTYVVIGGFGALGFKTCELLVKEGVKKLMVIGQSELGERQENCKTALEDNYGVQVQYYRLDVSKAKAYERFKKLLTDLQAVGGIIFAAGVVVDKYHANYRREDIDSVYASKINGTLMLAKVLKEVEVDFCVCYSSIVSVIGAAGQSVYGAANSFQDFICAYMKQNGINMFTVQWGPWGQVGMFSKLDQKGVERYEQRNIFTLTPEQALSGLKTVIQLKENIIVANMTIKGVKTPAVKSGDTKLRLQANNTAETTIDKVKMILALSMGIANKEAIDESKTFLEMGIDSLLAVDIRSKINKEFKVNLPLELFFDNMNIKSISHALEGSNTEDEIVTGEI